MLAQTKKIHTILSRLKFVILAGVVYILISDIYFIHQSSDIITFFTLGLFIFTLVYYKFSSKVTSIFTIALVILMSINYIISNTSLMTEKAALWVFFFIAISAMQQWREK